MGVLATVIFSFLIVRFTKKTTKATEESANVAKASYELAKEINDSKYWEKRQLRAEYTRILLQNFYLVKDAVFGQEILNEKSVRINEDAVNKAPRVNGLTQEQLALYFNDEEKNVIQRLWLSYNQWLDEYWRESPGTFERQWGAAANTHYARLVIYDFESVFNLHH